MTTILIVEDEQRLRELVVMYIKNQGWQALQASDGEQALDCFVRHAIDLVILDIMLPGRDGWSICRQLRKQNTALPIVMLTARNTEDDELFGFELGADEYITKPFNPNILIARISVLLRRAHAGEEPVRFESLEIDPAMHKVTLAGTELALTPREYQLLLVLTRRPGMAFSREQLLNQVWGIDTEVDDRAVDSTITRLRKKLGGRYIKTLHGLGYRFDPK